MISFICLFFPAFTGLQVYNLFRKGKVDVKSLCIHYGVNMVTTNAIVMTIIFSYINNAYDIGNALSVYPRITIRYLFLAIIVSILCAIIIEVIEKNLEMKVVVRKNEKNK